MGILDTLKRMAGLRNGQVLQQNADYRCIKCGGEFDRGYRECPDCGAAFVVPTD